MVQVGHGQNVDATADDNLTLNTKTTNPKHPHISAEIIIGFWKLKTRTTTTTTTPI